MINENNSKSESYNYLKHKEGLKNNFQFPGDSLNIDKHLEAELKEKDSESKVDQSNKSPEELVKVKEGDYDYYAVKKNLGLR